MAVDSQSPRVGDVYEAMDDVRIGYLTRYFDLPYTGGGDATLPRGERVRVTYARGETPAGVYCDPLRYDELHETIVSAHERGNAMYRGYYLAIDADALRKTFKRVVETPARPLR